MSHSEFPLVSMGIPTYNRADKLTETVKSLLEQDYPNFEIVVSDNASPDHTQLAMETLAAKDSRIKYIRQEKNQGIYPNFKAARDHSSGTYFMWISDDDKIEKNILGKYVDFLENNKDYISVIGQILYWKEGKVEDIEEGIQLDQESGKQRVFKYYSTVLHGAMWYGLFRRELVKDLPVESALAGDWHFLASAAYRGKIKQLDTPGYHKDYESGTSSSGFKRVLKAIGQPTFWAAIPFVKIGLESFQHISRKNLAYRDLSSVNRFFFALKNGLVIPLRYYGIVVPKIIAGKILRALRIPTPSEIKRRLLQKELS